MTTDADFERATTMKVTADSLENSVQVATTVTTTGDIEPVATTTTPDLGAYWVQHGNANPGQASSTPGDVKKKGPDLPGLATTGNDLRSQSVEDNGLEPMTSCMPCKRSPN